MADVKEFWDYVGGTMLSFLLVNQGRLHGREWVSGKEAEWYLWRASKSRGGVISNQE